MMFVSCVDVYPSIFPHSSAMESQGTSRFVVCELQRSDFAIGKSRNLIFL